MAGTDCFTMRVHPRIDSISATSGYLSGGQVLTITGWGLEGTKAEGEILPSDVTVNVAGQACVVTATTSTTITCNTGKASAVSKVQNQPGPKGLKHRFVNPTKTGTSPTYATLIDGSHPTVTKLATSMETQRDGRKR
jgi:hypothetical protein